MKKTKAIAMIVVFIMLVSTILNCVAIGSVNAEETVKVTRDVYSNNGSMDFLFTGLNLDITHEYEFGLTKTKAQEVEKWFAITVYTETTATVDVATTTKELRKVINATDTGYITIKDKTENIIVLEPYAVDLKTPFLQVSNYKVIPNGKQLDSLASNNIQIALRNAGNSVAYYQYEKITDTAVINKYKELKANSENYLELQSLLKQDAPNSGWQTWGYWNGYDSFTGMNGYGYTERNVSVPDTGLYYMWLYFSGDNLKPLYGCILVDNLEDESDETKNNEESQETIKLDPNNLIDYPTFVFGAERNNYN